MCRLKLYLSQKERDRNLRTKRISAISVITQITINGRYKPSNMGWFMAFFLPAVPSLQSQQIRHSTVTTIHFPRRPQGRPVEEIKVRSTRAGMFFNKDGYVKQKYWFYQQNGDLTEDEWGYCLSWYLGQETILVSKTLKQLDHIRSNTPNLIMLFSHTPKWRLNMFVKPEKT